MTVAGDIVRISRDPVGLADLLRVARGSPIELAPDAIEGIKASRAVVEEALTGPTLVYGLNTGLGHQRNERLPAEQLIAYQEAIVASHAGGFGPPLATEIVRAAMAVRVIGISRGGSGASLGVAESLVRLLNAGVHPVVPTFGSVGASDLMHMAAIAEVALGRGTAEHRGEILSGAEALRRARLQPLLLAPKDGLALVSANGVSIGWGALVAEGTATILDAADVALALSFEAVGANVSVIDPIVAKAKGIDGHVSSADHLRSLLDGSGLCSKDPGLSVQDPLSFRVGPQVHGAAREIATLLTSAVERELNAIDDNPLVSIDERRLVSNGNFQPMLLALALDAVRPALAHVGQLSDRRMNHLWTRAFRAPDAALPSGILRMTRHGRGMFHRYAAAVRGADLRARAGPVTLDVVPLDNDVEDHATNAPESARTSADALDALADVLAVEMLMARALLLGDETLPRLGRGTRQAMEAMETALAALPDQASSGEAVAALKRRLMRGDLARIGAARPGLA